MKKIIGILLTAALVLQGSLFTAFADEAETPIYRVDINNICTLIWSGEKPQFSVEFAPDLKGVDFVSGRLLDRNGKEVTISGDNISVAGGEYRYELTLSAKDGFVFANELEGVNYQGVDGNYSLTYSFPPGDDNHTMIVTGDFSNVIKVGGDKLYTMLTSGKYSDEEGIIQPSNAYIDKVNSMTEQISEDKYSYRLVLKTKEGFHFSNSLVFLYGEDKYGFTLDYKYSLSEDKGTLTIDGNVERKQTETPPPVVTPKPVNPTLAADKAITSMTKDSDPKGSTFRKLKLRSTAQTGSTIKLNWGKVGNAKMYAIYGNKCGNGIKPKRLGVSKSNTFTVSTINKSKLKKGTYYKFIVVAIDKNGKIVSKSKMICVTPKGGKTCNYKSVTVKKSVIKKAKKLRKGKMLKLKAKAVKQSKKLKVKKYFGLRYESTNKKVATVNSKGKITAKKKGTCYVYAYAQNGVFKKVKVTVK